MGLLARWCVAISAALAAFGACWSGLQAGAGVDAGVALGVAVVPFTVVLTLGAAWAAQAKTADDNPAGTAGPVVPGHVDGDVHGPVLGPGSELRGATISWSQGGGRAPPMRCG